MKSEPKTNTSALSFLQGGGEMGELIRNYPWQETPLGSPQNWPQSLRTSLGILLHSRFPMFLFWGKEHICFYNDAYRPSLGVSGKHPWALGKPGVEVWPEIWDSIYPWIARALLNQEAIWKEDQLLPIYRNGGIEDVYWTFSYSPVNDETGSPAGVLVACTETTQKVQTLKNLQTAKQRFHDLVIKAPVAITVFRGRDFVTEIANDAALSLLDKTREELIGKPLFDVFPETKKTLEPYAKEVVRTGKAFPATEFEIAIHRNGRMETGFFNFVWEPLQENGRIDGFMVVAHEITQQVIARKKIEESENRFRSLIEQAPIATCLLTGPQLKLEVANEIMLRYWGKDQSILGQPLKTAVPELQEQGLISALEKVFAAGLAHQELAAPVQLRINNKLQTCYFDYTFKPLRNANGAVYAIMEMATDVTEQVLGRQQIEQAEERVRLAISSAELGTYEVNLLNNEIKTSERFNKIWGIAYSHPQPATYVERIHPEDKKIREQAYEEALKTGNLFYEARVVWEDSSEHWVRVKGKVLFNKKDRPTTILGVVQDITEQKLFAEQLTRLVNERTLELENKNKELERSNNNLEEFAHAASHDLKEPIRKIHFFTDRLKNQLADRLNEEERFTFSRIENASQRMNALIDDLLLYSHVSQRPLGMEEVDLNEKINKVLEDLELGIQQKQAVVSVGKLPVIRGYKRQIQQLFQNLISNALKYSKPEGTAKIAVSCRLIDGKDEPMLNGEQAEKKFYLIEVKDNGIGFNQSEAERIFQMFQRLHGNTEYVGTGVGLAIARKVVENHHGFIYAYGEPGIGASFFIGLPVAESGTRDAE